ncbi:MAG TPA: FHA domain-containing protein [Kofleriaceae bacterium]|nr:FHA domain-containing protein [Kofleriaceae bacterium]
MLRVVVSERGQGALPAVDLDGAFAIGSGPAARVRLPAGAAEAEHVRIDGDTWRMHDGRSGAIGDGVELAIGGYVVRIAPAPDGAVAASPQRTESLARELVRAMLGAGAAPTLEVERGPIAGARRALAPPESVLVIGRGDDAGWIIADDELSRLHAEVRRGWDGARVVDLGSKHGVRLDGARIGEAELHDGALVELGRCAMRFRDPAERHLRGEPAPRPAPPPAQPRPRSAAAFWTALAIAALAVAALAWLLLA